MRLSEWRGRSPHKDAMTPKVMAVIDPVLAMLGADADPETWIAFGDDPGVRYLVLVPTLLGLGEVHVRVNVPQEGPRASGKLVRWNRVQIGELSVEMAGGHRILSFQVENQVLRGSDEEADEIAAFARALIAAIDGRTETLDPAARTGSSAGRATGPAKPSATRRSTPQPPPRGT